MLEGFAASFSRAISDGFRSFGTQRLLANTDENDSLRVLAHGEQEVSCSGLPLPLIALKASVTQSFWVYGEMWGWREKRGPRVPEKEGPAQARPGPGEAGCSLLNLGFEMRAPYCLTWGHPHLDVKRRG